MNEEDFDIYGEDELYDYDEEIICDFTQILNEETNTCEELQVYFGYIQDLYTVDVEAELEDNDEGTLKVIPYSFGLSSVSRSQMKMQFTFEDPYSITAADIFILKLDFNAFDDQRFADGLEVKKPMRKQLGEIKTLNLFGDTAAVGSTTALLFASSMQIVMNGALAQVFCMINGLQIVMHLPTINLSFPEIAFVVVDKLMGVFTFDIPNVEFKVLFPESVQPPAYDAVFSDIEDEKVMQLQENLEILGYGSAYITVTLGSFFIIFMITGLGLILIVICRPLEFVKTVSKFRKWLMNKLLWNFVLLMLIESSIITVFSFILTIRYGEWSGFGGSLNMVVAYLLAGLTLPLPFFFLYFYNRNYDIMNNEDEDIAEEFEEKWGAPMEGLHLDKKWSVVHPFIFISRRILFAVIVYWLFKYVIVQLALQLIITTLSYAYLTHFEPYVDRRTQKLEEFNEIMLVIIIDVMFCFTDVIPNEKDKMMFGYFFIVLITINIGVHMVSLAQVTLHDVKKSFYKK